ncbi:hypothetical protein FE633_44205 [Streptomyces montanus]|uniref:Uncharacterized protein n=1 Tax=Streptomyces montanus TaxID=2580423 RepID=A0A5R9F847_9ACTN|nr:hypothetical protein FE633_44205 [Streptomyces montanus]
MAAGGPVAIGKDEGLVLEHAGSMPARRVHSKSGSDREMAGPWGLGPKGFSPPPPLPVPSRSWGLRPQTPVSAWRPRPQTPDGPGMSAPPAFEERGLGRSPRGWEWVGAAGAKNPAAGPPPTVPVRIGSTDPR